MWNTPEKGWIKINFDGASRGNPGVSGAGCIARNDEAIVLARGAQRLLDGLNNEAEARAALLAILLADKLSVTRLHLKGDSKIVTDAIVKGVSQCWRINKIIHIIGEKIKKFARF